MKKDNLVYIIILVLSISLAGSVGYIIYDKLANDNKIVSNCQTNNDDNITIDNTNKTTTCTIDLEQSNYTLNSEYKITYDNNIVKKVEIKEVVESSDEDVINEFEDLINDQLEPYNNLKYYDFNVRRTTGKLTETVIIDYSKLDIDKFISINSDAESLFTDGKLNYDTIIGVYKQLGATCE